MDDRRTTAEQAAFDAWVPLAPATGFAGRVLAARAATPRSRRPIVIASVAAVCVAAAIVVVIVVPRGDTRTPVAELTRADGPVDREQGVEAWRPAEVGAKLYIGDAVRTADGSAQLAIGTAQIAMAPYSLLRFGSRDGRSTIAVELGAIDLTGSGSYALDVGDVRMSGQTSVRVSARGAGHPMIELLVGTAQVVAFGDAVELELGQPIELGIGAAVVITVDSGVQPLPVAVAGEMTLDVTGKRAERLAAGETTWIAVPAGTGSLARGSKLRLGASTTAKLVTTGLAVELASGSRGASAALGDDLVVGLELGDARVTASHDAAIAVPGGDVVLAGTADEPAEVALEINPRATRIVVLRGKAKLTGQNGEAELAMERGETAMLAKAGTIQVVEAIPKYFDLRVTAGETFTVHDPRGTTAVQFAFAQVCRQGGVVELDHDARFRTPKVSAGKDAANLMIGGGAWAYRVRCTVNGNEGAATASGRVAVLRDDGRRPLPKTPGVNRIDADGRSYTISYQSGIPNVVVRAQRSAFGFRLHLASGGRDEVFDSTGATITIPGAKLHEGLYTYWTERDGVKQDTVSTLKIDFDQTAPQVYIESPVNAQPWTGDVEVRGAVLAGWTPSIDTISLPLDKQRRFAAKVAPPAAGALVIQLAHPARGVHYYLRRPK